MNSETDNSVFHFEFTVEDSAIDVNGHVNNVVYIQWMQNVAIQHSASCGGTAVIDRLGCSWIVRSHNIDYLSPAFAGDRIVASTWVANFRKVRSLRRYTFSRKDDNVLLAKGATEWVYINSENGRPCTIPEEVKSCFSLLPDGS